jgi:hypothetical protein
MKLTYKVNEDNKMIVSKIVQFSILVMLALSALAAAAREVSVSDIATLDAALREPQPGDTIILAPGRYEMDGAEYNYLFGNNLKNVTIRSQNPDDPAIIDGNGIGRVILLRSPEKLTLENLIIENMTEGGLNIDDNDDTGEISKPWKPASQVTLRNLIVRYIGTNGGNIDGIKLSGLSDFHIDNVQIIDWGDGGSAIDMVGCHKGVIEASLFRNTQQNILTTGIVTKGGSKNITIRKNRFELPKGFGRAVKLGGSTSAGFFRFADGDSGYEASKITVEDNTVLGGRSAFSYVNIEGGLVQRNIIYQPADWVIRILDEAEVSGLTATRKGRFLDNTIVFDKQLKTAVNIGERTQAGSFIFQGNHWYNPDNPSKSKPQLPSPEIGGVYGNDPGIDIGLYTPTQEKISF